MLQNLPEELLLNIIEFNNYSPQALLAIDRVNRVFHEVISSNKLWFRYLRDESRKGGMPHGIYRDIFFVNPRARMEEFIYLGKEGKNYRKLEEGFLDIFCLFLEAKLFNEDELKGVFYNSNIDDNFIKKITRCFDSISGLFNMAEYGLFDPVEALLEILKESPNRINFNFKDLSTEDKIKAIYVWFSQASYQSSLSGCNVRDHILFVLENNIKLQLLVDMHPRFLYDIQGLQRVCIEKTKDRLPDLFKAAILLQSLDLKSKKNCKLGKFLPFFKKKNLVYIEELWRHLLDFTINSANDVNEFYMGRSERLVSLLLYWQKNMTLLGNNKFNMLKLIADVKEIGLEAIESIALEKELRLRVA